ncbi:serine/threonine-protein phosphatase 4 regulatory subunit 2-A-like isoform X2 [Lampris incognitus]|uniref:serine/threonine-protein phosphatase 4 regulatory subunit 2-A-like isoform X2 n=1 Tax=Lampris incognitus TaxID=2546036 RepID=UPI0024B58107|nr:serine/threonine-protein phosphatase 4 regulatory subunit 2-A-like isoform X2 [Lampris incognitus]
MEIDAVLEALEDFEKKGKKETCPALEKFLCHVAKTGETMVPWAQFKSYFLFKLEDVMDDFHASTTEQRGPPNPNVEYIPFDVMKDRILKIVDGYNGIPFTIQRLCELLTDPKRNYTGTDKFLRGVEKNVMVVSCVHPMSDHNVNGPGIPKPLNRPKLSLSTSLSTNGLPDSTVSKEPKPHTAETEEHRVSDSPLSEDDSTQSSGIKNKHQEDEDEDDTEVDEHLVKRLKRCTKEEGEEEGNEQKAPSCPKDEASSPELSKDDCQGDQNGKSSDTLTIAEDHEPSSTSTEPSERTEESSEKPAQAPSPESDDTEDRPQQNALSENSPVSSEVQDGEERCSSTDDGSNDSSEGEGTSRDKPVPTTSSNTTDLSTGGTVDKSERTETANEPVEQV